MHIFNATLSMNLILKVLLLLLGCMQGSQCLRILAFHPLPWRSHQFVFRALARGLGDKGHHVDFYTPLPMPDPPKTVNQIQVHDTLECLSTVDIQEFLDSYPSRNMEMMYECETCMIQKALTTGSVFTELMSSNQTYDIVITSYTLWSEPLSYIAHRFDALNVVLTPVLDHPWTNADLQEFMDTSPQGVIYFSLGTNIDAKIQTERVFDVLVNVFRKLKQKVLWKVSPGMPQLEDDKIRMQTWYPQQDILDHKNLVLFMTHGGLQSTLEAINSGVPILGMPVIFDQHKDIEFLTSVGMGLRLNFDNITEDTLSWTINEILSNPRYREQAKNRQSMLQNRRMKPLDEAIYWIEYVSRHGKVLQPASVHLPFYQLYLLDVIGTILVGLLLALYLAKKILRSACSLCCKTKSTVPKAKKKQ